MQTDERRALEMLRARGRPAPLDEAQRRDWQERFNRVPAMVDFGLRIDLDDPRIVRTELPAIADRHRGGLGTAAVNGAVLAAMFDCALGVAGGLQFPGRRSGTCELSIKFLRPAPGPCVTAYAITIKKATQLAFTESELYSGGRLCAVASGIVSLAHAPIEAGPGIERFGPPGV
ncbi:MAG: PaaI family thioesterase [Gammaproteobacteria bacterium]